MGSTWWRVAVMVLVVIGGGLLAGCRTYIPIERFVPGRRNIGAAKTLVLVQAKGRKSMRRQVLEGLRTEVRASKYFGLKDRRDQGGEVVTGGPRVRVRGGDVLQAGELGLLIEVYQFNARETFREDSWTRTERLADGSERHVTETAEIPVTIGEMVIGVTLFDHAGRAIVEEHEYTGEHSGDDERVSREQLQSGAGRAAIRAFFDEITPTRVRELVMVDKSDAAQFGMIEQAAHGDLAGAQRAMELFFADNPRNPAAAYNLAVFTEGVGDYATALEYYEDAIELAPKGFYIQARNNCRVRKDHADELAGK